MAYEDISLYEDMREDLANLGLASSSPTGFEIWISNLHTLNSANIEPVGQWVGLPIDEAEMDDLLDVLGDDGSEYYIADASAPHEGLSDELAKMTPEAANRIAQMYAELDGEQQTTFGVAMGIVDFSNGYAPEVVMGWIEDGLMYIISEDELAYYIEEWLDIYWTPEDWKSMVVNQYDYDALLLELANRQDGFGNYRISGGRYIIYPFSW